MVALPDLRIPTKFALSASKATMSLCLPKMNRTLQE